MRRHKTIDVDAAGEVKCPNDCEWEETVKCPAYLIDVMNISIVVRWSVCICASRECYERVESSPVKASMTAKFQAATAFYNTTSKQYDVLYSVPDDTVPDITHAMLMENEKYKMWRAAVAKNVSEEQNGPLPIQTGSQTAPEDSTCGLPTGTLYACLRYI